MLGLDTKLISSPSSSNFSVIIEGSSEVFDEQVEFSFVFFSDVSHGDHGSGLLVDESSQSFFVFNNAVRNILFSAQLR